jgi:hypothetical protein
MPIKISNLIACFQRPSWTDPVTGPSPSTDKGLGGPDFTNIGDASLGNFNRFTQHIASPPDNFTTPSGSNGTMALGIDGGNIAAPSGCSISVPGSETGLSAIGLSLSNVPTIGIAAPLGGLFLPCGQIAEPTAPEPSAPTMEVSGKHATPIVVILMTLNTAMANFPEPSNDPDNQLNSYDPNHDEPRWPKETDMYIMPGSNQLTLTTQHPVLHGVIQDAIEFV